MLPLARQALHYLQDLGLPATGLTRRRGKAVPYHLADSFELVELGIADHPVTLAIDQEAERSPAETEQLIGQLSKLVESIVVYVTESLTSYDRKRLIERRVSFLVPGNQLYLPLLGFDLREHFRTTATERHQLTPSAQAVLIAVLQHPTWTQDLTAAEVAAKLEYTPMTASRVARELAAADLVKLDKSPRGQLIALTKSPKETWDFALPLLRNPVHRTVYAKMFAYQPPLGHGVVVSAGMTELARRTMLADQGPAVFACSRDSWNGWKKWTQVLPHPDANTDEVQIWIYPPTLSEDRDHRQTVMGVDPLSLYLSLRDTDDPRVQAALDELMEQAWR